MCKAAEEHNADIPYYPALIIGAGAAGIAAGSQLKRKLGFEQFRIFDRQSGIGGVWWINQYPGVASDVPTALYSFSFAPNYVSKRLYPTGDEFQAYLQKVSDQYNLGPHIQLNSEVSALRWIESGSQWEAVVHHLVPRTGDLSTQDRKVLIATRGPEAVYLKKEIVRAKVVVSCVGILVEPNPWEVPGREEFEGQVFHSARWRKDVDLDGKDVVVLGTGCSAAQIVPSLLKEPYHVKSVTQVGRSAPWVMPRLSEPFGEEKYAKYAPTVYRYFPFLGYFYRILLYLLVEVIWATVFQAKNAKWRAAIEKSTLERMHCLIPKKYHHLMTPDYPYGCKRRVFDSDWLISMNKSNFTLTNRPIIGVGRNDLLLGPEDVSGNAEPVGSSAERVHADVVILANGFEATQWLHPLRVYGRDGVALHDRWRQRGGPQAYMGIGVDGFPNFFIAVGPNTVNGHNSLILAIENTVGYILKMVGPILKGEVGQAEVKKEALEKWTKDIQRDLKKTVFVGCRSWYMDERGYNSTMYPHSQTDFTIRCMFPRYSDWNVIPTSSKGNQRSRGKTLLSFGLLAGSAVAVAYYFH